MIQVGVSLHLHRQLSSISIILRTPAGTWSNQIREFLIQYIIKGIRKIFEEADSKRKSFRIFLDVCGVLGGYAALWQANFVIRVSAGAPCETCIFRHQSIY